MFCVGKKSEASIKMRRYVPVSQVVPVYPSAHAHPNPKPSWVHVAPFKHGLESQRLITTGQKVKPRSVYTIASTKINIRI